MSTISIDLTDHKHDVQPVDLYVVSDKSKRIAERRKRKKRKKRKSQTGPRVRHWCFTSYLDVLPTEFDDAIVRYCCYQREVCSSSKRPHFQGYIELCNSSRIGQVKMVLGKCHCEPRRGTREEARAYCCKKETAVQGTFFEFGVWRNNVSRKRSLHDMLQDHITLDDLIEESPVSFVRYYKGLSKLYQWQKRKKAKTFRNVEVVVLVGLTGTGKTRKAAEEPDHFFLPCSQNLWFDGYEGEKCLILDDFDGGIQYQLLLRILDGHEIQVQIKGGFVYAMWTKVVITSNSQPSQWYLRDISALMRRIDVISNM